MSDFTRIMSHIERGDSQAAEKLLPLVDDELQKNLVGIDRPKRQVALAVERSAAPSGPECPA